MALDDQLAALAAGELDDDTARALRARAAGDPALARRLARHEQLQRRLVEWEAPALSEPAVQRLDARIDEALAALGDEPLAERTPDTASSTAAGERPDVERGGVVDLGRARRRRETGTTGAVATDGGGTFAWPGWAAGAAVAAVLAAVVGTGVVLGGLPGGGGLDMMAGGDDSAEESADMADDAGDAALSGEATDGARTESAEEEAAADAPAAATEEGTQLGPAQREGVDVAEGDLLALVDLTTQTTTAQGADEPSDGADEDGSATTASEPGQQCVDEALERDTTQTDDREVQLLADGTYAGREAAFVVIRTPGTDGSDRYEVLAYDPGDCSLLARDETSR